MAIVTDPEMKYWRTDVKRGRGIYVLISNDIEKPSEFDPLIGTMESSELAEIVVDTHNRALEKYGRHFLKALMASD